MPGPVVKGKHALAGKLQVAHVRPLQGVIFYYSILLEKITYK